MVKKLGVHGLVKNKNGLYLVMKRFGLDKGEGNCWDPVGGGIEEAGIDVYSIKLTHAYSR